MTSSLEPTCLFDGTKQINQLVEQKVIGSYHLQLFCGTVQQIQSKMNSDRNGRKNKPEVQTRNVEVTQQLGVFVKERKNNKEV